MQLELLKTISKYHKLSKKSLNSDYLDKFKTIAKDLTQAIAPNSIIKSLVEVYEYECHDFRRNRYNLSHQKHIQHDEKKSGAEAGRPKKTTDENKFIFDIVQILKIRNRNYWTTLMTIIQMYKSIYPNLFEQLDDFQITKQGLKDRIRYYEQKKKGVKKV